MVITAEQIRKERYGDSTVYYFYILVDGIRVQRQDNPEEPEVDREFGSQVQDGCCQNEALIGILTRYKQTLTEAPSEDDMDPTISV